MARGKFVAYYRVSTARQGISGLGLAAQKAAVETYLTGGQWTLLKSFTETESGRNADRPALGKALAFARAHRAKLIVANVSRLTRSSAFLSKLLETKVEVRFCDLPQIEGPQGRFMLQQMASIAELEGGLISQRTKAALEAARERGTKLGGIRPGQRITEEAQAAGRAKMQATAQERAEDLRPIIGQLREEGVTSLRALAFCLTEDGVPTPSGATQWNAMQVSRLLKRLAK
jgi:DNA invertase Pin-like site-specific DNA recombinase